MVEETAPPADESNNDPLLNCSVRVSTFAAVCGNVFECPVGEGDEERCALLEDIELALALVERRHASCCSIVQYEYRRLLLQFKFCSKVL